MLFFVFENVSCFFSSIVRFDKLTPIAAEKPILNQHYGKKKKFTNAVNVMKKVLKNIDKEKAEEKQKAKEKKEQEKSVGTFNQRAVTIFLTRLKEEEIVRWSSKPRVSDRKCAMKLRNR